MAEKESLPPGMFKRGGIYYVRKRIKGVLEKKSTGQRDFKRALRRYHEIMKDWNDGVSGWDPGRVPTFADYWTEHYRPAYTLQKTPVPGSDPKRPLYRDDTLVTHALATFGRMKLDQITHSLCQRFALRRSTMHYTRKLRGGKTAYTRRYAAGTLNRELSFLQAVFEAAVRDGHIERNPMRGVDRPKSKVRTRVLTLDEQERLLAHLTPRWQRWVLFMLGTGLRVAEARNIDPERDLHLEQRSVTVTRKTRGLHKKMQQVPLFDDDVLTVLREQLAAEGQLWPHTPARFQQVLTEAAEKAGLEALSPHALRHSFATRYLQGGGDIYTLSQILGHSSVRITEKVYVHLRREDLLAASKGVRLGLFQTPAKVIEFPVESRAK